MRRSDGERERALVRLASRQHGLVSRPQLAALGFSASAIAHRLATGRLVRLHRGVFAVGPALAPLVSEAAALVACGPAAVLSHRTAGALWELVPSAPGASLHVTVTPRRRAREGMVVHGDRLAEGEIRRRHGLRVTSPERTLRDLAPFLAADPLEAAIGAAEVRGLVGRAAMGRLRTLTHRRGAAALRAATTQAAPHRSEAERRLLVLLRRAGLPPTAVNVSVAGYEVDLLYAPDRVIVEMDGYAFHRSRRAFERDHTRDTALSAAGYTVLRVTWRQLTERPESIVTAVARTTKGRPEAALRTTR